jgi:uncharacterized ion transporter superfamily protein YfcC
VKREEVDRRVKEVEETYSDRFTHQARSVVILLCPMLSSVVTEVFKKPWAFQQLKRLFLQFFSNMHPGSGTGSGCFTN